MLSLSGYAQQDKNDYQLGAGDSIRIMVFQSPDLTLETRVSENGAITYPLIGTVQVGGLAIPDAELSIAQKLKDGGFVQQPQVNIVLLTVRGNQVAVLGMVNRPGRFPLETNTHLSEIIATAGGVQVIAGAGSAVVNGMRQGKPMRKEIDVASLFLNSRLEEDMLVAGGDVVYIVPGNQVAVLGQVNRPGRYSLETFTMHLSEVLSLAGGIAAAGSDNIVVVGKRQGQNFRKEIDLAELYLNNKPENNIVIAGGDEIYVARAPMFYIYGEVQKPGSFRVERGMTVIQALAQGGGPTVRGTEWWIRLHRRNAKGEIEKLSPKMTDTVQADDVVYVRESLF